jgi:hypothetical protein
LRLLFDVAMIKSFCQRDRIEHPATLTLRQIDHPPIAKRDHISVQSLANHPRRDSGLLEPSHAPECGSQPLSHGNSTRRIR